MLQYIADTAHYTKVLSLCEKVRHDLWIATAYIGSANLTGAGMGMKGDGNRNFEAGILTDEPAMVSAAIEEFDKVWRGSESVKCQRRNVCPDPIV